MTKAPDNIDYSYFRDSLESLGCPYISALDNESLRVLLFRPGEARLRVFQWLLSQLSSRVEKELGEPVLSAQVKDSKIQRLVKLTSGLGLCSRNDYELIQGNCGIKRQVRFYTRLLEMLDRKTSIPRDADLSAEKNSKALCNNTSRQCYNLINDLTTSLSYRDLFSKELDIFPPSLVCVNSVNSKKKALPALEKLSDRAEKFLEELTELHKKLADLQEAHQVYEQLDSERLSSHRKTLYHTISTLNQTIGTFTECYESEFKHWSDKPQIVLNKIGPLCKKVDEQIVKVLGYLETVKEYNESVDYLGNIDLDQKLVDPISHTEFFDLTKRLETLRLQFELRGS